MTPSYAHSHKLITLVAVCAGIAAAALPMALGVLYEFVLDSLFSVIGYAIYAVIIIGVIIAFKRQELPNRWEITILSILTLHSLPSFGMLESVAGLASLVGSLLAYPIVFLGYDYLFNHTRIDPTFKLIIGIIVIGIFYFGSNMLYGLLYGRYEY